MSPWGSLRRVGLDDLSDAYRDAKYSTNVAERNYRDAVIYETRLRVAIELEERRLIESEADR